MQQVSQVCGMNCMGDDKCACDCMQAAIDGTPPVLVQSCMTLAQEAGLQQCPPDKDPEGECSGPCMSSQPCFQNCAIGCASSGDENCMNQCIAAPVNDGGPTSASPKSAAPTSAAPTSDAPTSDAPTTAVP